MNKILLTILLLALIPPPADAEEAALGRLFLSPQQRQELDRLRLLDPVSSARSGLTINGEVRSSSGRRTRWINGRSAGQDSAVAPALPVGDSFDPNTGEHQPLLGDGRIRRTPRQP